MRSEQDQAVKCGVGWGDMRWKERVEIEGIRRKEVSDWSMAKLSAEVSQDHWPVLASKEVRDGIWIPLSPEDGSE